MSPLERAQIKQRIYNLRLYKFHAEKLLHPANWSDRYLAALQHLANDHNVPVIDAAKIVHDFAVQERDIEIDFLRFKLGEHPSKGDVFENIVIFPSRSNQFR